MRKNEHIKRSKMGRVSSTVLTRIVRWATLFAIGVPGQRLTIEARVCTATEKKAVAADLGRTKVTSSFGQAFANI
jgi:hypothetical protein